MRPSSRSSRRRARPARAQSGPQKACRYATLRPARPRRSSRKEGRIVTQAQTLRKLHRTWRRQLEKLLKEAYEEGRTAGLARAHGLGRRGRTIREDTKV